MYSKRIIENFMGDVKLRDVDPLVEEDELADEYYFTSVFRIP